MDTPHKEEKEKIKHRPQVLFLIRSLTVLVCLFAACTDTQSVVKIGLVAPFEGLYRQMGYDALAAMRAAIAADETDGIKFLPLAMDSALDSTQAQRTTAKMLTDPTVQAIIGPMTPSMVEAVFALVSDRSIIWRLPFLGDPAAANRQTELIGLIHAIAEVVNTNGEHPLVLAGWTPGWPELSAIEWTRQLGHTARISNDPDDVVASETVIWLGEAASGADYFAHMRIHAIDAPFWLALAGDSPVFYQRAIAQLGAAQAVTEFGEVYGTAWLDDGYPQWAATHTPNTPTAYAIYQATQIVIAQITGREITIRSPNLYVFQRSETGAYQSQTSFHTRIEAK